MKAEQYLRDVMTRFKNRVVYDAGTGEIRDDRKHMTMLEDFWLPRREGGRGTEITTLPGGQNLGEIEDIIYFQRKLYRSLNVPVTRLDTETQYNFGRATEVSRDEVKFAKFITRLRTRFGMLFTKVLEKH
jgi:Bacteriophage T4-like capsid assembly protein (Gp20).